MTNIESDPSTRAEVASRFSGMELGDHGYYVLKDMSVEKFINNLAGKRYQSSPLVGAIEADDATDMPRAWRFMLPTLVDPRGLVPVEFGVGLKGELGVPDDEARFTNEMHIDQDLRVNQEANPLVKELYKRIGGDVVKRVGIRGEVLFSGIERRYRIVEQEGKTGTLGWSQLIYSRELLKTQYILSKHIDSIQANGGRVPEWAYTALHHKHRHMVADAMALSALAVTIES